MRIGLDFHDVITAHYDFFKEMARLFVMNGHEVHIITGAKQEKLLKELEEYPIMYTHIFSIVDECIKQREEVWHDDKGDPWVDNDTWNRMKAKYCKEKKIDIHFDDSETYGMYFHTPYCQFSLQGSLKHKLLEENSDPE